MYLYKLFRDEMTQIKYDDHLEQLLKDQAEICESLSILHRMAYEKYNRYSNSINLPVIIGSSAIGFATGVDIGYDKINIVLGIASVIIGCIKALDSYFQLAQRSERHRLCSLQYSQIFSKIAIELALEREDRIEAKDALGLIKTDIKNIQELSPIISDDIIAMYKGKYPRGHDQEPKRPNITNGLSWVVVNTPEDKEIRSRRVTHDLHVSADLVMEPPIPASNSAVVVNVVDVPISQAEDAVEM